MRGANGLVERHLLQGGEVFATRNGKPLQEHRVFLPPLYVLQAESGAALRRSLEELQIRVDTVGLSQCDEEDCLGVGDPAPEGGEPGGGEAPDPGALDSLPENDVPGAARGEPPGPMPQGEGGPLAGAPEAGEGELPAPGAEGSVVDGDKRVAGEAEQTAPPVSPGLWIDRKSFGIRGLDAVGGVRTRMGPEAVYDGVRFPGWVEIQEPGQETIRLHVLAISPVLGDPEVYGPAWLLEPLHPARSE